MSCPDVVKVTVPSGPAAIKVPVPDGPAVIRVATPGPPGPPGPSGAAASSYLHTQSSPSDTWTMVHNLGFKPSVELLNTGSQEVEGDVVHQSINVTIAYFTTPLAGFARLN